MIAKDAWQAHLLEVEENEVVGEIPICFARREEFMQFELGKQDADKKRKYYRN
ncbi:hypothetical protein GCM10007242_23790 [Pigmentiphaga litoralis]|nr:hypothetical protein GCM10007242_23790 [Pigmentiphaga litoralis]